MILEAERRKEIFIKALENYLSAQMENAGKTLSIIMQIIFIYLTTFYNICIT